MQTPFVYPAKIIKVKNKYECYDLDAGQIKPEAETDVREFIVKLNDAGKGFWTRNPAWVYVFALCFILSFIVVGFMRSSYLYIIPLVFLVLFITTAIISCIKDNEHHKRLHRIKEEYRTKLAPHYILVDKNNGYIVTPDGRFNCNDTNMHINTIRLVPVEYMERFHAIMTAVPQRNPYFEQEQVALYEQAQMNKEIPIYHLDINKVDDQNIKKDDIEQPLPQINYNEEDKEEGITYKFN